MSLIAVGSIGAPILAIGGIEIAALLATSSTELVGLELYTTEGLKSVYGFSGTAMTSVLNSGLSLTEAAALGIDAGALQAYRQIAINVLKRYALNEAGSVVGEAIQAKRIAQITKMLGF